MNTIARRLKELERLEQVGTVYAVTELNDATGAASSDVLLCDGTGMHMTRAAFEQQYGPRGCLIEYQYIDRDDKEHEA